MATEKNQQGQLLLKRQSGLKKRICSNELEKNSNINNNFIRTCLKHSGPLFGPYIYRLINNKCKIEENCDSFILDK